uniref:MAK10-like protein n=1 Tax=Tanacetum cinerariifolium TaxID=118510 RepID=A0A699HFP9_TANCI|nr:MAK10-like protein [Tanacetum cinerariifolium]
MENENPIRTQGDYSRPSHEGYRSTIELPDGNNMVPLQFDTIRLVQNGCSFHGLRSEDPNQHLKDFLKLGDLLNLDVANRERTRLQRMEMFEEAILKQREEINNRMAEMFGILKDLTSNFVILDQEDKNKPFILGTSFLTIANVVIRFDKETITLKSRKNKIDFVKIPESLAKLRRKPKKT